MSWDNNLSAAENKVMQLLNLNYEFVEALKEVLGSQVIRSDKDNMEFDYRLSCFTVEKLRKILERMSPSQQSNTEVGKI